MKIYTIFDIPWESCDKKWLYEKLDHRNYEVFRINPKKELYTIEIKNHLGYFYSIAVCFFMSLKTVLKAKKGDCIICWKTFSGMFAAILAKKDQRVISLNWLTPQENDKWSFLRKIALKKNNIRVGVNSLKTKEQLIEKYGQDVADRIFYVPDVPEKDYSFEKIGGERNNYCFTGGINNRDWKVVYQTAKDLTKHKFVCAASEKYFKETMKGTELPLNMKCYFDLSSNEYYEKLKKAYLMVLPLKDERVAGLINVIKAIEFGVLPLTSKNEAIEQYYPEKLREVLQFEMGNVEALKEKIEELYSISEETYAGYIEELRTHLIKHFTSDAAIDCIIKQIR